MGPASARSFPIATGVEQKQFGEAPSSAGHAERDGGGAEPSSSNMFMAPSRYNGHVTISAYGKNAGNGTLSGVAGAHFPTPCRWRLWLSMGWATSIRDQSSTSKHFHAANQSEHRKAW